MLVWVRPTLQRESDNQPSLVQSDVQFHLEAPSETELSGRCSIEGFQFCGFYSDTVALLKHHLMPLQKHIIKHIIPYCTLSEVHSIIINIYIERDLF